MTGRRVPWSEILDARLEKLNRLVEIAQTSSPFYRRKLWPFRGRRFEHIDAIRDLPFTTRAELLAEAPFGTVSVSSTPEAYYESTGTTGDPLPGFPDLSFVKAASFAEFLDAWMGLRRAKVRLALVALAYEMNPTGIRFQLALPQLGITVIPCGVRSTICPPEKTVDLIARLDPEAIFSRPFELLRYGDLLTGRGLLPDGLNTLKLFYLGETMSKTKWERIRGLWNGADLFGHYGLTEVDAGLHTCYLGGYHEPSNPFVHLELVDLQTLEPLATAASWGEAVFTTLRVGHAVLIRYRTGDLVRRVPCGCGDPAPAYEIRGRIADGVAFGGEPVFPADLEDVVFAHRDVGNEYLFVVRQDGRLELRLERAQGSLRPLSEVGDEVAHAVSARLGVSPSVHVVAYGGLADKWGIPRKKGGRFTDLRGVADEEEVERELRVNVVDGDALRAAGGRVIGI